MGYFIALLPPFFDSIITYIDKFLLSKYDISATVISIFSGIFALFVGLIILLFTGFPSADLKTILVIISSGFAGVFILQVYCKALSYDETSRVTPLFQMVPVLVLVLSFLFLGEKLQIKQYIGAFAIIIAGFLFSVKKLEKGIIRLNKAFWFMLLASFFSAMVYILFKTGVKELGFWPSLPFEGIGNGIGAAVILLYHRNYRIFLQARKYPRVVWINLTISEVIYRISRLTFFFALSLIAAPFVSVLMGFQPVFTLIMGIILSLWFPHLIKEIVTKKTVGIKVSATILIFIGLYLIFI